MTQKANAKGKPKLKQKYRFTKKDCQRGYRAALARCMDDWSLLAWFQRRVKKHYRRKK